MPYQRHTVLTGMRGKVRTVGCWMLRIGVAGILLAAVIVSVNRLLLPRVADYRTELEQVVGDYLHAEVRIRDLAVEWRGWGPSLRLSGLDIYDAATARPVISFAHAAAAVDVPGSLLSGVPVFDRFRLLGAKLALRRDVHGQVHLFPDLDSAYPIDPGRLVGWLLRTESLDIERATVSLFDGARREPRWVFHDVGLSLRGGDERRLGLSLLLPGPVGGGLAAAVTLRGDPDEPSSWRGDFYLNAADLEAKDLPLATPLAGRLHAEVWGNWHGAQLRELAGTLRIRPSASAAAAMARAVAGIRELRGYFAWNAGHDAARWRSDWTAVDRGGIPAESVPFDLAFYGREDGDARRLEGRLGRMPVAVLAMLAQPLLDDDRRGWMEGLAPQGTVTGLDFVVGLAEGDSLQAMSPGVAAPRSASLATEIFSQRSRPSAVLASRQFALTAAIDGLSTRAWRRVPGVSGLNASLVLGRDAMVLDLSGSAVAIDTAGLLRAPLSADVEGSLRAQRTAMGLRIESRGLRITNADGQARLTGAATLYRDGASPLLDLNVDYRDLHIGRIHRYLPAQILNPKLVAWLDRALVSGRVPKGHVRLNGRLADFPFDRGGGLFEARFQARDLILAYSPGWPRAEDLDADVRFRNRSLAIEASDGRIFDVDVERISAVIDDLDGGVLTIRGRAHGGTDRMLRFLRASPLRNRLGGLLRHMQATGENRLDLTLLIPLNPDPNQVEGIVTLDGNGLLLPALDLAFSDMRGPLNFTEEGLSTDGINLRFRGEPALLTIEPQSPARAQPSSRIGLRGAFELQTMLGAAAAGLQPYASGRSTWDLAFSLPAAGRDAPAALEIAANSDLRGIAVTLPPPFGKRADERRPLIVRATLAAGKPLQASVKYGDEAEAVLEFTGLPADPRLERGELRIDAGEARLPDGPGLVVVANLREFDVTSAMHGTSRPMTFPRWISGMVVQVDELTVRPQAFTDVKLVVTRSDEVVQVNVTGRDVDGRFRVPAAPGPDHPVRFDIRRLVLNESMTGAAPATAELDPRAVPALAGRVEDLILDGRPLGQLSMLVMPRVDGVHLETLDLTSDQTRINASGTWLVSDNEQMSSLRIEVHSGALGESLRVLGIDPDLQRGETDAEFDLAWPAPLTGFSAALVDGHASIRIGKGQLRNVEPGVGRMMGLFNLGALSRRLALDFSDLFDEGLGFDRIEGTFSIRAGQAQTSDLIIEAPSGLIQIEGRVGLAAQDYDAVVTVAPRIGTALPIAGAIAGGPAVGAALLVADWLLERGIDQAVSRRYRLTGSWDDPVVQPVVAPAAGDWPAAGGNR